MKWSRVELSRNFSAVDGDVDYKKNLWLKHFVIITKRITKSFKLICNIAGRNGTYIHTYIHAYVVKLCFGPTSGVLNVIIWANPKVIIWAKVIV